MLSVQIVSGCRIKSGMTTKKEMLILYHFLWTFLLIFLIPAALLSGNRRFRERLALNLPKRVTGKKTIWVHALSVGEVLSALPLLDRLKADFPDKDVVLSVTTRSGMTLARERASKKAASIITSPLDAWWCVRRLINHVRPSVFILVETDIWPGLLYALKRRGINSLLVNGRISPRTFRSYRRAPAVIRHMFAPLKYLLMQTDLDRNRLLKVGMGPYKVITTGNIKYDREMATLDPDRKRAWRKMLGLTREMALWVAGSTHEGEEAIVLRVFGKLKADFPLLRLMIAPRDVKRSGEIADLISGQGMTAVSRTGISEAHTPYDVVILDTVGELGALYGIGDVAFVGGSLVPIGGHNLLEPADSGIPVVFGPHMHNFELMSKSMLEAGGALMIQDPSELQDTMGRLLADARLRGQMGMKAKAFVAENRGALKRVVSYAARCMGTG